jgi:two-component system response regulator YesN
VESELRNVSISFYSKLFEAFERAVTWDEIKELFTEIHQQLFQMVEPHDRESRLSKILDYIHHHYGKDLSIERFADQLDMSVGNFSRVFKEVTGEKYGGIYHSKLHLSHAKRLLLETNLEIDDIAEKVGYQFIHPDLQEI